MNIKSKLVKQKIYENWSPKVKKHLEKKGIKNISEQKLRNICEACQVRRLFENATATVNNTPGRGAFSLGNNTANANDTTRGSGEHFEAFWGVFIDTYASCVGFDILPNIQMTKSNFTANILEPVYAGGILDSKTDRPELFQVQITATGTPAPLVVGNVYEVKEAFADEDPVATLTYVGRDRARNYAIFRLTSVTGDNNTANIQMLLTGNAIFQTAGNYVSFNGATVQYVNANTNFIQGFAGSGLNDTDPWRANRSSDGRVSSPMSRQVGETQKFRNMGFNKWSENFSAETFQVKIGYTTELLQDLAMEEGEDAVQLAFDTIANELDQSINSEILTTQFATGWGHHKILNDMLGINLNLHIDVTDGSAQTYFDERNVSRTIPGASGALVSATGGDNLPSMQRRIVSRAGYTAGVIGQRNRGKKGNIAVTNTTLSSAMADTRAFQPAPFENDLVENQNLYLTGSFKGVALYEDPMMEVGDNRISVSSKGSEKDPGLKLMNYILGEKLDAVAEGTMQQVSVLKSRLKLAAVGTNPHFNYLTFTVTQGAGQAII